MNGSYVIQGPTGEQWNLRGNYGSLKQHLKYTRVKALGMNLQNDRSYAVVFDSGTRQYNPSGGSGLTRGNFDEWAARL